MTGEEQPTHEVAAVVLAAGASTRFGRTKALAKLEGRALVHHVIDAAVQAGVDRIVVVVGHDADNVADAVAGRAALASPERADRPAFAGPGAAGGRVAVEVVVNADHATGQGSSVRAGLAALEPDPRVRVAVMLLADQPGIDPAAIRRVVLALEDGCDAARARYADRAGHPVAFHRRVWSRLLADVVGDVGARDVLEELAVAHVLVPGPSPPDVDVPEDLRRLSGDVS